MLLLLQVAAYHCGQTIDDEAEKQGLAGLAFRIMEQLHRPAVCAYIYSGIVVVTSRDYVLALSYRVSSLYTSHFLTMSSRTCVLVRYFNPLHKQA